MFLNQCRRTSESEPVLESKRPYLIIQKGNSQLYVEKEPFIILGGQLLNSSASNLNNLDPKWDSLKALNINTVILPISWQQFEPEEGEFNYYLIDGLISKAREYKLHLVIIWYGSWKGGMSGYVPEWVINNPDRFPRMENNEGKKLEIISCFSKETRNADTKAFIQLMKHLKEVDQKRNTVLMVQVQDEIGLPGSSRDYSSLAEIAFQQNVPVQLIEHLEKNIDKINPVIHELWKNMRYKKKGTWQDVFGVSEKTNEIFMAWHYAIYINNIIEKGRAEYRLPLYVNTRIDDKASDDGNKTSGSPVIELLDIWKAGAPEIDFYAVSSFGDNFVDDCENYNQDYNPLFVPSACALWKYDTLSAAAKSFYIIGNQNTIGFAPYGIDHKVYSGKHSLAKAYQVLGSLASFIIDARTDQKIKGFMQTDSIVEHCNFENISLQIDYNVNKPFNYPGFGLAIQTSENEFIIAGNGCNIRFKSLNKEKPNISVIWVEEGQFVDGEWKTKRVIGGDEMLEQGTAGIKLPPDNSNLKVDINEITVQKVKIFLH